MLKTKIVASKKVVVCITAKATVSKSGLILNNAENKPETGEVIVIGEGKLPVSFKVGDVIVFRRYTDNRINVGGVEYNFVQFKDVLGVVSQNK